ncbi:MAG: hypothetical protein U5K54_07965 [Cytophagales bacterium]|nr:hypothetical protein [Cytophagales bacterium]
MLVEVAAKLTPELKTFAFERSLIFLQQVFLAIALWHAGVFISNGQTKAFQ